MKQAQALYERNGFERLSKAMGNTGHHGCDLYYVRTLRLTDEPKIKSVSR